MATSTLSTRMQRCAWPTCERWFEHWWHLNQRYCSQPCREKAYRARRNAELALSRQLLGTRPTIEPVNVNKETHMNRIILVRTASGWLAVQADKQTDKIVELFGTAAIPTPFDPTFPAEDVQRAIANNNPNTEVIVLPGDWRNVEVLRPVKSEAIIVHYDSTWTDLAECGAVAALGYPLALSNDEDEVTCSDCITAADRRRDEETYAETQYLRPAHAEPAWRSSQP